jgi:hypothetical protein
MKKAEMPVITALRADLPGGPARVEQCIRIMAMPLTMSHNVNVAVKASEANTLWECATKVIAGLAFL